MFLLLCSSAFAYGIKVHAIVTQTALEGALSDEAPPLVDPLALEEIRTILNARGATNPAWVARYPSGIDAWQLKELLLLAPDKTVSGIDEVTAPEASTRLLVARAATEPDADHRNIDRLAYDASRKPLADALGKPVPADPALLNMGRLGVLSSQAHAHYGLVEGPFSEDSKVLQSDPPHFAVASSYPKGPVMTLAAEMAQANLDLSLLAGLSGQPTLSWLYTGQAFHYLEDVCNPIHTVQVGLYDFFVDAFKERLWLGVKTGGGYLGPMRSLASIGIDILSSHHTISEQLTEKRLVEAMEGRPAPEATRLMLAMRRDDLELVKSLEAATAALGEHPERGEFGLALTRATILASSVDGEGMYRATRAIADPRYRREGVIFDWEKGDPDAAVRTVGPDSQADFGTFWEFQARSLGRAGTVLRQWVRLQQAALAVPEEERLAFRDAVADRLISRQLRLLSEAEARRADYLESPPDVTTKPERAPGILLGEVAILAAIGGLLTWRIRKRR